MCATRASTCWRVLSAKTSICDWRIVHIALDITREENVQRFVEWHATVGVETNIAEAFPWALDMLRVAGEREDERVAAVDLRMQGLDADEG